MEQLSWNKKKGAGSSGRAVPAGCPQCRHSPGSVIVPTSCGAWVEKQSDRKPQDAKTQEFSLVGDPGRRNHTPGCGQFNGLLAESRRISMTFLMSASLFFLSVGDLFGN